MRLSSVVATDGRLLVLSVACAMLLCLPFLLASPVAHYDDAYIFYRYVERIVAGHGLEFNLGQPSLGLSSALWTVVLVLLRLFLGPALPVSSKLVGALMLAVGAGLCALSVARRSDRRWLGLAAGVALAANPLAVILAVSGMETGLAILLVSAVLLTYQSFGVERPLLLGALCGLLFLTRPEAAVLPAVMLAVFSIHQLTRRNEDLRSRMAEVVAPAAKIAATAALTGAPWVLYVYSQAGSLLPPTRVGKLLARLPAEHGVTYLEYLDLDLVGRVRLALADLIALFSPDRGGVVMLPWVAALVLGAPLLLWTADGRRSLLRQGGLLAIHWGYCVGLLALVSLSLPLPMPRYVATMLPVAVGGSFLLIDQLLPDSDRLAAGRWQRGIKLAVWVVFLLGLLAPLGVSLRLFASHARVEAVGARVGEWLRLNTEAEAIIATEPIGRIGYYSDRSIVDLGGLTDPSLWPYLEAGYKDTGRMYEMLRRYGVTYLVDRPTEKYWSLNETVVRYPDRFKPIITFGERENNGFYVYRFEP